MAVVKHQQACMTASVIFELMKDIIAAISTHTTIQNQNIDLSIRRCGDSQFLGMCITA